jgi:ribosomal protein S18 acetylase RimI-like enzyme
MEYPIRHLKENDYDALISLWRRAGLPHRPLGRDSREAITSQIGRADTIILGMFDGDILIGSIIGSSDGRKGWLNRLAIDPDYRGQGLAGELIKETEKFLRDMGLKVLACLIEDENLPSISVFRKAGYIYGQNILYFSKRSADSD